MNTSNMSQATLAPALPALRLVTSPSTPRKIAKALLGLLGLALVALLFVPWQQSVRGTGQVVAYAPLERMQTIQANISGRVYRWGDGIQEGLHVAKGQKVVEIRDVDEQALERLELQRSSIQEKARASKMVAEAYNLKLQAVTDAQKSAIAAAEQEVEMADQKILAEEQGVLAADAALSQSLAYYERKRALLADRLASPQDIEIAQRKLSEDQAKLKQAKAYVSSAQNGLEAKKSQLLQKQQEAAGYCETARAEYQKSLGEVAIADKELSEIEGKLARQRSQVIVAPRDGTIVRLLANEGGDIVKQGDPLFVLVPEAADRAVEIWVSGNDAPLVSKGEHVRLQFEGWPAVQFAGWPSVAVGTFGGTVVNVDAIDNGKGQFRVLAVPDGKNSWPADRYLRQGVRVNGWVLLNQVPLGYEVWRQLNGFPPVVSAKEPKESDAKGKIPKVKL